jgi:protein TonB
MAAIALYREFALPWTPSADDERRLRRVLGAVFTLFVVCGVIIPFMPDAPRVPPPQWAPTRVAEFLLPRPQPKPEPVPPIVEQPKPAEQPRPEPVKAAPKPVPKPLPRPQVEAPPRPDPRVKAASTGLLAMSKQLTELRQIEVDTRTDAQTIGASTDAKTRVDRALLTAKAGEGSGGINVAAASSGFGRGSTGLKENTTAQVTEVASTTAAPSAVERTGQSRKASRTREEVELVFDRNKSAIYSLYSRALRDNPALQGKVVLEVTIAASGEVTDCRIVSSELKDPELERKLVARVRMFRFEARDVAVMTTTKPIEFFPA